MKVMRGDRPKAESPKGVAGRDNPQQQRWLL